MSDGAKRMYSIVVTIVANRIHWVDKNAGSSLIATCLGV
jgi:hypothetical protein